MKKEKKSVKKKVVAAMSGGVDSSVAAALLKKQGFDVIGAFMKFWSEPQRDSVRVKIDNRTDLRGFENRCCSSEAEVRARKIAKILKIPFYVFNFEKEFKKRVVDYFLNEYKSNKTPNPCVVCNKEIKFGLFFKKALKLGADFVATGHYIRLRREIPNSKSQIPNLKLLRGKDKDKDQSYFLWTLNQKQLKHILFPIGDYTKTQVRNLAKKFNLSPVLDIPESQEICFIHATVNDFLKKYLKRQKPGPIVDLEGKTIGRHQGLAFYTIGQRKGIELSGGPFYVAAKNLKKNTLVVVPFSSDKNLFKKNLIAKKVNWISGKNPLLSLNPVGSKIFSKTKMKVQIRYGHKAVPAIIKKLKTRTYEVAFSKPQQAITPGQSAVFYRGKELLGGGIISNS